MILGCVHVCQDVADDDWYSVHLVGRKCVSVVLTSGMVLQCRQFLPPCSLLHSIVCICHYM